jgi:hypothetical protein
MHDGNAAAVKPVAGEIHLRPEAGVQSQHLAVEIFGALEIGAFEREVLQLLGRHADTCGLLLPAIKASSRGKIQPPSGCMEKTDGFA